MSHDEKKSPTNNSGKDVAEVDQFEHVSNTAGTESASVSGGGLTLEEIAAMDRVRRHFPAMSYLSSS